MKKFLAMFFTAALLVTACETDNSLKPAEIAKANVKRCAATELLELDLKNNPSMKSKMDAIENFTDEAIRTNQVARLVNGVIEIPVVVHVIYRTATENISLTQIQSQIDVLNEDFNNTNADRTLVPAEFAGVQANFGIRFVLDRVIRKSSTKKSWSYGHAMKSSSTGGSDPVDPTQYLNIWVVNKIVYQGQVLLGFATFPGGPVAQDGLVIGYDCFGRTGAVAYPYNKGRTATHEIGHWMNLRHIWGDATCGNDFVSDTPVHANYNFGCPSYPKVSSCAPTHNEMTMNYMDYTDDACMYMFSNGQKDRALALFTTGGPRAAMAQ